jgi:hypothetical protein
MAQQAQRRIALTPGDGALLPVLTELGIPPRTTTLVINGETSDDTAFPSAEVSRVLRAVVTELASCPGPVIISGGTRAGVFALLGQVVADLDFPGPVVGVVPAGKIEEPDGTPLEPHHTEILMVDGADWGDETATMLALCRELDRRGPVLVLIAGGGEQTMIEIEGHLADNRSVVALAGTGRAAEDLARWEPAPDAVIVVDITGVENDTAWRSVLGGPVREEAGRG